MPWSAQPLSGGRPRASSSSPDTCGRRPTGPPPAPASAGDRRLPARRSARSSGRAPDIHRRLSAPFGGGLSVNAPKQRLLQVTARSTEPHPADQTEPAMTSPFANREPELLTITEAAELLRAPVATLRYWRHQGTGPRSFRLGRRVLYRADDLRSFIDAQHGQAASDPETR